MPHSYVSCCMHYVFSTKDRRKIISSEMREQLWAYIGGIARKNKMKALAVGGTADHVHVLLALHSTISLAKAIQLIKGGSSKWISGAFSTLRNFAWQEGYGVFSISISGIDDTVAYIKAQDEHHKKRTFKEEFLAFLRKHSIEYDERYIWG